jgi:hypothetical protein
MELLGQRGAVVVTRAQQSATLNGPLNRNLFSLHAGFRSVRGQCHGAATLTVLNGAKKGGVMPIRRARWREFFALLGSVISLSSIWPFETFDNKPRG